MKKATIGLLALLLCGAAVAQQDTTIDERDVRNPKALKVWLEANAADAEARLAAGGSVSDTLQLINANDAGTAKITLQADKADDAGDKYGIVATDGSGLDIQSDAASKGTLATVASVENTGLITTAVGIDAIGAVDLDIGSADVTDVTVETDGGTVILDGSVTASNDLVSTDDVTVGDDLVVTGAATVGETLGVTGNTTLGGTLAVTGAATLSSTLDVDSITVDAGAGIDTQEAGTLVLGEATATKVEISKSGVETEVQGTLDVHEGLDVNEDVTIDLNAADEEIVITQASTAGTEGAPLLFVNDDRTGATANSAAEATLSIDAEGLYGIAINDGALFVEGVSVLSGNATADELDSTTATPLLLGKATATGVTIGATDADTTVAGNLIVTGGDITGAGGNSIDISEATDNALTLVRHDAGAFTITCVDNDANADLTIVGGGTGDVTIGDVTDTSVTIPIKTTDTIAVTTRVITSADYGKMLIVTTNAAVAITLPANGAPAGAWFDLVVGRNSATPTTDDCAPTVSAATADTLITPNSIDSDSVTWGSTHRIGAAARFFSDGYFWHVQNLGGTTMTYTDTD